jgi:hypothetical protein
MAMGSSSEDRRLVAAAHTQQAESASRSAAGSSTVPMMMGRLLDRVNRSMPRGAIYLCLSAVLLQENTAAQFKKIAANSLRHPFLTRIGCRR